jgi:hypothetical protein
MDYTNKYLKYKNKYLALQSKARYLKLFDSEGFVNKSHTSNKNKFLNLRNILNKNQTGKGSPSNYDEITLPSFYMASSHNTYLESGQLIGTSSIQCYINFINQFKGGCVELDAQNPKDNDIIVGHGTATGELKLSLILQALRDYVLQNFDKMLGPIIISFDNKKLDTSAERAIAWDVILNNLKNTNGKLPVKNTFLDTLIYNFNKPMKDVKLGEVKGLFLIKWGECFDEKSCEKNKGIEKPSKCPNLTQCPNLLHWTHLRKASTKKSIDKYNDTDNATNSISEPFEYPVDSTNTKRKDIIKSLQSNFLRIYPSPTNINSANYNILGSFLYGAQMVALNVQRVDEYTLLMKEIFKGGCMRLKPQYMLADTIVLEPLTNLSITISSNSKYTDVSVLHPSGKWYEVKNNVFVLNAIDINLPIVVVKVYVDKILYWNACELYLNNPATEYKLYPINSSRGFLSMDNLNCSLLYNDWDKSNPITITINSKKI